MRHSQYSAASGSDAAHRLVQRRDLVVELLALLVEAAVAAGRDFAGDRLGDRRRSPARARSSATSSRFSARRASPSAARASVAIASASIAAGRGARRELVPSARRSTSLDVVDRERAQHVHARTRQQRAVDLERRVLGRRADEADRAVLDERQERVLLRLVEAVHLVEEQHRAPAALATQRLRLLDRGAHVLDAGHHGRERDELRIAGPRDEARERRLAGAGRAPEHHRVQAAAFEQAPQRLARRQQVRLADELVEARGPHAVGQRAPAAVRRAAHFQPSHDSTRGAQPPVREQREQHADADARGVGQHVERLGRCGQACISVLQRLPSAARAPAARAATTQ